MTTTERGRLAEALAADYLEARGFELVERNWHNRWCEIDLVMRSEQVLHVVEVKYRQRIAYGLAAEYVSADKLRRLRRAASAYIQAHGYHGAYQLDVMTVEGDLASPQLGYLPNV